MLATGRLYALDSSAPALNSTQPQHYQGVTEVSATVAAAAAAAPVPSVLCFLVLAWSFLATNMTIMP